MLRLMSLLAGLLVAITPCGASAEETAEQVVAESWKLYRQAADEKESIDMVVAYKDGRKEEKSLTRWLLYDAKGEDRVTIKFTQPAMDDGLGLLLWRHADKDDDQWLKLPSMERVRRISTAEQDKYFAGTDLTYEDTRQLMGERTKDFTYRIIQHDNQGWQIEGMPKQGVASGYGKRVMRFSDKYACTAIEYFGKDGKPLKAQQNSAITFSANGQWRPGTIEITNNLLQRSTVMNIRDRKINSGLSADIFSAKYLESARR
jgi:outer membrane lipoprotein-sorting protein